MPQSTTLHVSLTQEQLDFVNSLITSGEYASADEVVTYAVRALRESNDSRELWLRETAVPAYEKFLADPSRAIPFDELRAEFTEDLQHASATR